MSCFATTLAAGNILAFRNRGYGMSVVILQDNASLASTLWMNRAQHCTDGLVKDVLESLLCQRRALQVSHGTDLFR